MRIKGMWTDGSPKNNPIGEGVLTTRWNKNLLISDKLGSITNERGFELFSNTFNNLNAQPIGVILINNNRFVICGIKSNGLSFVGLIDDNGNHTEIVSEISHLNKFLNFNPNYPIHGEYFINVKNEVIIALTDGYNEPKTLNIDDVPTNMKDLFLFDKSTSPIIIDSSIEEGGTLLTGAYYPIFRLIKEDGTYSKWYYDYAPFYITDKSISVGINEYDGTKSNENSNKALNIDLVIQSTSYKKIEVGYIHQAESIKIAAITGEYDLIKSSNNHINDITGETITGVHINLKILKNTNNNVDLGEIIIENASYKTAQHIAQNNNQLYMVDLKSNEEPDNIQQYINNAYLTWRSELLWTQFITGTDKVNKNNNHKKGFAHDEVYAFYLRLEWSWGWGKWYVMNGRLPNSSDKMVITKTVDTMLETDYLYKLEDTNTLLNTDNTTYAEGEFGYWENENETYPLIGGFPTGNVRHYKFPSMNFMKDKVYQHSFYGTVAMDKLGVKVNNLNLTSIKDCDGNSPINYEIGYAKRNGYNNQIQGQTPVLIREGFNYTTSTANGNVTNDKVQGRLYPFELLRSKSSIIINKAKTELKLLSGNGDYHNLGIHKQRTVNIIDYSDGIGVSLPITHDLIPLTLRYVPNNVKVNDDLNNYYLESYVKIENNNVINYLDNEIATSYADLSFPQSNSDQNKSLPKEQTILLTLLNYQDDYYMNFDNQEVISTGRVLKNEGVVIYGGDVFINSYSFLTGYNFFEEFTLDVEDLTKNNIMSGTVIVRRLLVEGQYNINLRHIEEETNLGYTYYHPKSGVSDYANMEKDRRYNAFDIGYNTDYNALLEVYGEIHNGIERQSNDKFKIIRSQPQSNESQLNNWRNFKQNDYAFTHFDKGDVTNIAFARDWMYVHHEKSLLRTRSRNEYQTTDSGEKIHIGLGDIFQSELYPVLHSETGELGTQHKFSCYSSKHGYLFCDAEKGKWFLINDRVIELSEKGFINFFKNNSNCVGDNPYFGFSIQSIWDDEFRRFIISRNFKELSENDRTKLKGSWKNDEKFINSLQNGDIVYIDGKYKKFLSLK